MSTTLALPKLTARQQVNRLSKWLELITEDDIAEGVRWYADANQYARKLARRYKVTTEKVAQVISLLSPQVAWETNKENAETIIREWRNGTPTKAIKIYATASQKDKCYKCLQGLYTIPETAKKTFAFYRNIMLDDRYVTIDRHAAKAAMSVTKGGGVRITPKQYDTLTEVYRKVASKYAGIYAPITGYELQAVIWVAFKRINNR